MERPRKQCHDRRTKGGSRPPIRGMENPNSGIEDEHCWVVDVHNDVLVAEVVLDDLLFEVNVSIWHRNCMTREH